MPGEGGDATPAPGRSPLRLLGSRFRWFLLGTGVSNAGTWMHTVAQSWLVLELTASATAVGVTVAAQYVPVLLLSPLAGVVIDKFGARRVLAVMQAVMVIAPAVLGLLVLGHRAGVVAVVVVAVLLGAGSAFESTARQAVVGDMVDPADLRPALSLASAAMSLARFVAPALAALIIVTAGTAACFLANAASFLIALACTLALPRRTGTEVVERAGVVPQLVAGIGIAVRNREIGVPLVIVGLVSTVAWNYPVVLPVLAARSFDAGAGAYGWFTSAMGLGALIGALIGVRRAAVGLVVIGRACAMLAGCLLAAVLAPTVVLELFALAAVGAAGTMLLAVASAGLQLAAGPAARGRVMGLWTAAFLGTTPLGSPLIGLLAQHAGARAALLAGAAAAAAGCGAAYATARRSPRTTAIVTSA